MLATPTLRKLLREGFGRSKPLMLTVDELGTHLRAMVEAAPQLHLRVMNRYHYQAAAPPTWALSVTQPPGQLRHHGATEVYLRPNGEGGLTISDRPYNRPWQPVGSFEELTRFIDACQQAQERQHARAQKRKKSRNFRAQACLSAVRTLADELEVLYYADVDGRSLRLIIALAPDELFEFKVPLVGFQDVLAQLRLTITALRDLHAAGTRMRQRTPKVLRHRRYRWTNDPDHG